MSTDSLVAGTLYTFKLADGSFADLFVPGAIGTIRVSVRFVTGTSFKFKIKDGAEKTVFIPGAQQTAFIKGQGPIEGPSAGSITFYTDTAFEPDDPASLQDTAEISIAGNED